MMLQRANNRPLLMQQAGVAEGSEGPGSALPDQADTVERARRRALFRVRNALQ